MAVLAATRAVGRSLDQASHYKLIEEAMVEAEKLNAN
jgi:hypothetical protein